MKSLVIYDSVYGNTKIVAAKIAEILGARVMPVKDVETSDLEGVELLVVGSPINGWKPLPGLVAFLDALQQDALAGVKATSFDTRIKLFIHGDAKDKIAAGLKKAGAGIVATPEAFYVRGTEGPLLDGELDRAAAWAQAIFQASA